MNQNSYSNSIAHHGVKGQRWGVRRYHNDDGSLTAAGKKRQAKQEVKAKKALTKAKARYREVTANKRKAVAKKVAIASGAVLGTAGLTAAAVVGKKYVEQSLGKLMLNILWEETGGYILKNT